jgi:hypothetical protein
MNYQEPKPKQTLADLAPFRHKHNPEDLNSDEVRQGTTGHGVRYVLAISLGLSLIALYVAWQFI